MADIIRPIEPFELTQGFGENPANYAKFGLAGHNGWDLRTKFPDTPQGFRNILASWLMEFYRQGSDPPGYGIFFETVCKLTSTWKLTYAHCQNVEIFTQKNEGEVMAISDNTGNSTGSHLHLTVKRIKIVNGQHQVLDNNNGYFGAVNPQEYFDELRQWKKNNKKPVTVKEDITMTIEDALFKKLVHNSTEWDKTVSEYKPGNDPEVTSFEDVRSVVGGYKSRITSLEGEKQELQKNLNVANQEIDNRKEQLANQLKECQRLIDIEKERYNALLKTTPDVAKLEGLYKGQIEELQEALRTSQREEGILKNRIAELEAGEGTSGLVLDLIAILKSIFDKLKR